MQVSGHGNEISKGNLQLPMTTEVLEFFRRQDEDSMLLAAIAGGDRVAFRRFYDRHAEKVATALRQLGRGPLPEDLFQEVFLAVWRKASTFDSERGEVGGWLFTICRNKFHDQFRRRGPHEEIEILDTDSPQTLPDSAMRFSLKSAVHELRSEEQVALWMVYYAGFTYGQAAEQLDVPLGTLKSRLRTALRNLSSRLGGQR